MNLNGKKSERMLLRVSEDMARSVRALAELEHRSIQDQFRFLIANALQQAQQGSGNGTSARKRQAPSTNPFAKQNTKATASNSVERGQLCLPGTVGPVEARRRKTA
jgi:hypothetical protein